MDININKKNIIKAKNNHYFNVDVTNKSSIVEGFKSAYKKFNKIDILINCAGASCFEPFEKRTEASFDLMVNTNLKGTFMCIQEYHKRITKKKHSGNIINISSIYGIISPNFNIYNIGDRKNSEIYGATKAGIIQMTKYFATHLAEQNIRVNCVSPGGIFNNINPQSKNFIKKYSKLNPMKRMANYNEIIGAIIYLSSDASSYTTGHNLVVDGGMSSW